MRFTAAIVAVLAAITEARVILTNSNFAVKENVPFDITWAGQGGPVTVVLMAGQSTNLREAQTLTSNQNGNVYTWVPTGLKSDTYAFKIIDSTDPASPNYSLQFSYQASAEPSSGQGISSPTNSTGSTAASATATPVVAPPAPPAAVNTTNTNTTLPSGTGSSTGEKPKYTNVNAAQKFASPLGFLLVTAAALAFFQ